MLYSLIHRPNIDTSVIRRFQSQYDPYYHLAGPHIPLIFPTPEEVGEEQLVEHIKKVLATWLPFKYHLKGLEKSWDNWLFLMVQEGNDEFVKLHDELYSAVMALYLRKDIPYRPHVGLGLFVKKWENYFVIDPEQKSLDQTEYKKVLKEAEEADLDYWSDMDNVELFTMNDKMSRVVSIQKFNLGS